MISRISSHCIADKEEEDGADGEGRQKKQKQTGMNKNIQKFRQGNKKIGVSIRECCCCCCHCCCVSHSRTPQPRVTTLQYLFLVVQPRYQRRNMHAWSHVSYKTLSLFMSFCVSLCVSFWLSGCLCLCLRFVYVSLCDKTNQQTVNTNITHTAPTLQPSNTHRY